MNLAQRTFAYCRVSGNETDSGSRLGKKEQESRLIEQEAVIREYCKSNNLPAPEVFAEIESGGSKTGEHRTKQTQLLKQLRAGDLVVVAKLDRWSRDVVFDRNSYDQILAARAEWYSIQEPFLAGSDPQTIFMRTNFSNYAEYEKAIIKIRTVGKRQKLRREGAYVEGLPPFGYQRAPRVKGQLEDRILHISKDAPLVREIFERASQGSSIIDIIRWLRESHPFRRWHPRTIAVMLRSRLYLGEIERERGSKQYIPAHEAIVDTDLFAKVQVALDGRKLGGKTKKSTSTESRTFNWLLRGVANCSLCGSRIGAMYGGGSKKYNYYVCNRRLSAAKTGKSCGSGVHVVEDIDPIVSHMLDEQLTALVELFEAPAKARPKSQDFSAQRTKLETKRSRILTQWADEEITDPIDYKRRLGAVDSELRQVEAKEAEQRSASAEHDPEARRAMLATLAGLGRIAPKMTAPERRQLLTFLAAYVEVRDVEGSPVVIMWRTSAELFTVRRPS